VTVAANWQPAQAPLMTRWAKDVSPTNVHPEYPRPQMVRKEWQNLNGLWDYAITAKDVPPPTQWDEQTRGVIRGSPIREKRSKPKWDGKILVPFPIESALSGVMKRVYETNRIWYRRTFEVPKKWSGKRVLLHFGAVDWEATVWVNGQQCGIWMKGQQLGIGMNGQQLGSHRGGYDAFTFDITDALKPEGEQEILVAVWDSTDSGTQPRGKQVHKPEGCRYTPSSGIWQTVWMEPVSRTYLGWHDKGDYLEIRSIFDENLVRVRFAVDATRDVQQEKRPVKYEIEVLDGEKVISKMTDVSHLGGVTAGLPIENVKEWTPENPFLYGLKLKLVRNGEVIDEIESYFAMRKVSLGKDEKGFTRIFLNNKPFFQYGLLDQGFWPDGLYTAPTDEALRYDIEMTKKLGFNLARKHVKIEPDRWYYWCDKLGLLVWQDMPSGDHDIGRKGQDLQRTEESTKQFETELKALIDGRGNHPCIISWVLFNEGWGQFDTKRLTKWTKDYDPSRLVISASGWADRGVGDINDVHKYPGPMAPRPEEKRATVLGEFGGLGLPIAGHTWQNARNWGYRSYTNAAALTTAYLKLLDNLCPLIETNGLSAAVYTQTTDVEIEVNGMMTYDRALVKMDPRRISEANESVYRSSPGNAAKPAK
jgi:beta-galactosidase/beta-glucuronidase